jgi:hypothetical protein
MNENMNGMNDMAKTMNGMGGGGGMDDMGMEQGEDFVSSIGDYGATMATMMFGQCFEGMDMEAMMNNPFQAVENRCSAGES